MPIPGPEIEERAIWGGNGGTEGSVFEDRGGEEGEHFIFCAGVGEPDCAYVCGVGGVVEEFGCVEVVPAVVVVS
jgi:hypothetical protein